MDIIRGKVFLLDKICWERKLWISIWQQSSSFVVCCGGRESVAERDCTWVCHLSRACEDQGATWLNTFISKRSKPKLGEGEWLTHMILQEADLPPITALVFQTHCLDALSGVHHLWVQGCPRELESKVTGAFQLPNPNWVLELGIGSSQPGRYVSDSKQSQMSIQDSCLPRAYCMNLVHWEHRACWAPARIDYNLDWSPSGGGDKGNCH